MTGQGTVNAVDAATVTATLGAAAGSVTINGDDSTNTVNLVAATAVAGTTTDAAVLNLAGTVAVDNENAANTVVENLTLSGNGAAASYDIADATTAANTLETLTVTGDQNVTITASAAALGGLDAAADYSDTSTAGTTTVVMDTRATVDLTHVKADLIEFGVNAASANTLTVANGQAVGLTASVTTGGVYTIDSTELTTGDETLNLTIEATQGTNALVASDFEVINLTIDDGSAATTTAQTITVAGLTGAAGTDINISSTLDNLTLTAVTADNIIATNMAGILTVATTANVDNITGGSGADDVDHDANSDLTFVGGAGADVLGVSAAQSDTTITFNGGAGNDTLSLETTQIVTDRYVLTNVEFVDTNNNATTVDARDFSGQTLVVTSTGGTNVAFTFDIANTTNVDLSGISGNDAQIAFANSNATAIATTYSGTQLIDTITTGAGNDTITGNGGADIITGAAGSDTINGGAGADTVTFLSETAAADTITLGAGDDILNQAATAATTMAITKVTDMDLSTATAAANDTFNLSLTAIEGLTTTTDLVDTSANSGAAGDGTVVAITTDGGTVANADLVVLSQSYSTDAAALAGMKSAGSDTITYGAALTDNDSFLVAYSDGTNLNIAVATSGGTTLTSSEGLDSVATILQFTGISSTANLDSTDFAIIA